MPPYDRHQDIAHHVMRTSSLGVGGKRKPRSIEPGALEDSMSSAVRSR
jgi:hypothetical protein